MGDTVTTNASGPTLASCRLSTKHTSRKATLVRRRMQHQQLDLESTHTNTIVHNPICRVVSFDGEEIETQTTAASTTKDVLRPSLPRTFPGRGQHYTGEYDNCGYSWTEKRGHQEWTHHHICTVISFDEEEDTVDQGTGTTSTEILLNPPMAMIVPRKHQSTLQQKMRQLRLKMGEIVGQQSTTAWNTPTPIVTADSCYNHTDHTVNIKGDESRRSSSISRQRREMRISHHQKKGIDEPTDQRLHQ